MLQRPPSPALSLREKFISLKNSLPVINRPLPDPPDVIRSSSKLIFLYNFRLVIYFYLYFVASGQKKSPSKQQPQQEIRSSPFDSIKRPPSVTMEKIKATTAAALDRMSLLQQRYRQHQEAMRSDSERSRRTSTTSSLAGEQVRKFLIN